LDLNALPRSGAREFGQGNITSARCGGQASSRHSAPSAIGVKEMILDCKQWEILENQWIYIIPGIEISTGSLDFLPGSGRRPFVFSTI
jgi:hypothetical protein